ncbi:RNA-binding domain-containing protein [Fomitiporia mediterranea MF3/22]|uniref:RNA-binding domain-containing protein n=1 Tax=Fomitiporia mediterranea (strain MF3/22) TaxID=694068 RepID=UPI0004408015|nr:RNA-binding domain-containing protein [Fomitiporia mediterranea MF3/22]EJD04271.1 RNA-binding domain-containing protein [Fomitiporia mediterranea MF3/22]
MASPGAAAIPLPQDKWAAEGNGVSLADADGHDPAGAAPLHDSGSAPPVDPPGDYRSEPPSAGGPKSASSYREKQIKPNKVYIGGLPEHTRREDLQSCFGKIGEIVNIELKLGYGFVEFETREAAEESVAKYHEGFFMGNKIRVEMSHGGGRTAKYNGDPGACFKCGMTGHWARECPNHSAHGPGPRRPGHFADPASRDYPPPPRDYPYREDYGGRYPPKDPRYAYDYPPPPSRDYRRPPTPPRDYRDYPPASRAPRDYDDYRMRPPPGAPPRSYYPGEPPYSRGYEAREFERGGVERRGAGVPPADRYPPYGGPPRPRTPPGPPPPRARDDYDRPPPRDYAAGDYRGRPTTPPLPPAAAVPPAARYGDYPPRGGSEVPGPRYRRRSQSPPPRSGGSNYRSGPYPADHSSDTPGYPPTSAPYNGSASYSSNGYSAAGAPPRSGGSMRDRDYPPRNGAEPVGYTRRA